MLGIGAGYDFITDLIPKLFAYIACAHCGGKAFKGWKKRDRVKGRVRARIRVETGCGRQS